MKITKIAIGIVAVLSLSACMKGSKVTRKEFNEKATAIEKENNLSTAKLDFKETYFANGSKFDLTAKGNFKRNTLNEWIKTDTKVDHILEGVVSMNLFEEYDLTYMLGKGYYQAELTYEVLGEETFYVKPFGYDTYYERSSSDTDGSEVLAYDHVYYQWNEHGYLTKYETESGMKSTKGSVLASIKTEITIKYK